MNKKQKFTKSPINEIIKITGERSMIQIYKKLMVLLDKKQKRTMIGIIFIMLIGAILEALGISVVVPIVQVVMDEHILEKPAVIILVIFA